MRAKKRKISLTILVMFFVFCSAIALPYFLYDPRNKLDYSISRSSMELSDGRWSKVLPFPETDGLPVWSPDTKINQIACNREYKKESNGWVIKQWKNEHSLCFYKQRNSTESCDGADLTLVTKTSAYCHWKDKKTVFLSLNSKEMANKGCKSNAKGNVGGYVSYLAWEPRILPDYFKKKERYMLSNVDEIFVRFGFRNTKVDDRSICEKTDDENNYTKGVVHSYATATFSEISPETGRGTGRSIFYQILNYDARRDIQGQMENKYHYYLTCNYKSNKYSTMIYRDSVTDFHQEIAYPPREGGGELIDYEFNIVAGVKHGLTKCYEDADPNNFKFAGFHIGTEIKNGAKHSFAVVNPEIEIIYNDNLPYYP